MSKSVRKKDNQINLLPQEGFATTGVGRVLMWVLSSFRIIVIVTELIVMIAFLSRFILDANNSDLNEELQQKSALIDAQSNFEEEFKQTQKKLLIISEMNKEKGLESQMLGEVVSSMPPDLLLSSIRFSESKANVSGVTPNEKSIQQFIVNLNSKAAVKSVALTEIKSDLESANQLKFKFNILY